ncbi:MAG: VOC family protein [Pseudomonadota bacterium]
MTTLRAMPVLQVSDTQASVVFYERLGFASHGIWGDAPAGFAIVQRGDVTLALDGAPEKPIPQNQWWAAYIYISDAAALRAEFADAGLNPTDLQHPTHYGCIDFDIVDPDGHRLAFGQSLSPVPGPGLNEDKGHG